MPQTRLSAFALAVLFACIGLSAALCAYYFYCESALITLPADLIMWSESDMAGNMIKLMTGQPFYGPPQDSNAMIYTPGASILTYTLLELSGTAITVPHVREVQVVFALLAAALATYNARLLHRIAFPDLKQTLGQRLLWIALTFCVLFLACTAPRVNRFVGNMHTDSAALLVSMIIFWSVLRYVDRPSRPRLWLMAALPGAGYFFKQFLSSWIGAIAGFLFVDQPKNWKRVIEVVLIGGVAVFLTTELCVLIWGDNFKFWCFTVMGGSRKHISLSGENDIALARSVEHLVRAWLEVSIGLVAGFLMLRGERLRRLGPLWLSWLALIASEALSSGAGWAVLYHFGPGVVIACTWLMAALPAYWPGNVQTAADEPSWFTWLVRPVAVLIGLFTVFAALHVVPNREKGEARTLPRRNPPGLKQYIAAIEHEFEGMPPERVLLDVGNWIYLKHGVLQKDRAVSLADQPIGGHFENFAPMIARIEAHAYDKILLHNYHKEQFLYDWFMWRHPSGVRKALQEHYQEIRTIPGVTNKDGSEIWYLQFVTDVSVLVPKK